MNKRTVKSIVSRLNAAKAKVAKGRDELRAIEDEVQEILDGMDDNVESITSIVDMLSRYL